MLARGSERETGYSRVNERTLNPRVSDRELSWMSWQLGQAQKNGKNRPFRDVEPRPPGRVQGRARGLGRRGR